MKLVSLMFAAAFVAGAAGCATAPAPIDYKAALMAACPNTADDTPWLTKAVWDDGDTYHMKTRFEASGAMPYAYENRDDTSYDNGRWSIEDTSLKFDMNDHYADYEGVFDGTSGSGTMKNVAGNRGTWVMERACEG